VIGATLLIRSLYTLSTVNPGFNPQHVLTMKISPNPEFCKDPAACISFYDRMLNQGRGERGIIDAALVNAIPLDGSALAIPVDVEDHPRTAEFPSPMFWAGAISPGYLRLMGISLLAGRPFTPADARDSEPVVLVADSTARRFWPGQNAIGKHVKWVSEKRWRTVVGVVSDVKQHSLTGRAPAGIGGAIYMPYPQSIDANGVIPYVMNLLVKTGANTAEAADELRRFAAGVNPNVPVGKVTQLGGVVGESLSGFRATTLLFLGFASVALALAAIGIYGLVSYAVTERAYEIALRMAIGATSGSILRMILFRSLRVSLLGMSAGILGALIAVRAISTLLFEVVPAGPAVYALVSAFMLVVTVVASVIPAWHASRMDPVRILRGE